MGTVMNTATVTTTTLDSEPGNNVASQPTEIREAGSNMADVYVAVTAAIPERIVEGESFDIPIQYGNRAPPWPPALSSTPPSLVARRTSRCCPGSGIAGCLTMRRLACSLGTLPAGSSAAATLRVRAMSSGYFAVSLSIYAQEQDFNYFDNFFSASTLVLPSAPRLLDGLAAAIVVLDLNHGQEKVLTHQLDLTKGRIGRA